MKNENKLNKTIFNFWNNYLDFGKIPDKWKTIVISHNIASEISENEFLIFEYLSEWRVISVNNKYFQKIKSLINYKWYDFNILRKEFENLTQKKSNIFWPVISLYLYSTEKLLPINYQVKKIEIKDKKIYDDFFKSCLDSEKKEVDMDLEDLTHRFFVLYNEKKVVSMGNYSIDEKTNIAHIWIITPKKYQWRGYGKQLVNTIIHDILSNNLIPQYRAKNTNIASLKIAKSLWFEPVLETFTFKTIS